MNKMHLKFSVEIMNLIIMLEKLGSLDCFLGASQVQPLVRSQGARTWHRVRLLTMTTRAFKYLMVFLAL